MVAGVVFWAVPRHKLATALFACWFALMAILVVDPHGGTVRHGCTLTTWIPLAPSRWFEQSSDSLNIWVFVIFGLLFPWTYRRWQLLGAVIAFPLAIEIVQRFLSRDCSSFDVVNNWTGIALGLAVSLLIRWLTGRRG